MIRIIPIHGNLLIEDNVWVAPVHLQKQTQAVEILDQAIAQANSRIHAAQCEADAIHQHAFRQGYDKGVCALVQDVVHAVGQASALQKRLEVILHRTAVDLVADLLGRPECLEAMFARWLKESGADASTDQAMTVVLPQRLDACGEEFVARLRLHWSGTMNVEFVDGEYYRFRCDQQFAELNGRAISEELAPELMVKLGLLTEQCGQISGKVRSAILRFIGLDESICLNQGVME
ncbi:hypothetical protein [Pseudomonas synxantha]|uniref:hypothetical protein n=1 Tax=Pseudomonas synxantha TaxID=47883 RepID=UPI000F56A59E|nr:hypothetical protein [Pseudomonas synxantha]